MLRRCPDISWTLIVNSLEAVCSFPFITSAINCCCQYIHGTEPLPSYQQLLIVVSADMKRPGCNIYVSAVAPDQKTDLPDTCPCTPIPWVFIFPIFYQAGEGIYSVCSVKSYCNHTALILYWLTSCILLYS
jgi:hypothetical protein